MSTDAELIAAADYALGVCPEETARLGRQAIELRPETVELLDRIALKAGQNVIDLGCGPRGILEQVSADVLPGGRVVGLDADPTHVAAARAYVAQRGLTNVEVIQGDARHTGLPADTFDLVHARTLLAPIPRPAEVVVEMGRIAKPGGWVASQEPDISEMLCYPPIPEWARLSELFWAGFSRRGADLMIGRKLTEFYREAGLVEIDHIAYANNYPPGHSRRTLLPDLVRSMWPMIIELGLATEEELKELDEAVRVHLADPRTIEVQHLLFVVWGRKPPVP